MPPRLPIVGVPSCRLSPKKPKDATGNCSLTGELRRTERVAALKQEALRFQGAPERFEPLHVICQCLDPFTPQRKPVRPALRHRSTSVMPCPKPCLPGPAAEQGQGRFHVVVAGRLWLVAAQLHRIGRPAGRTTVEPRRGRDGDVQRVTEFESTADQSLRQGNVFADRTGRQPTDGSVSS